MAQAVATMPGGATSGIVRLMGWAVIVISAFMFLASFANGPKGYGEAAQMHAVSQIALRWSSLGGFFSGICFVWMAVLLELVRYIAIHTRPRIVMVPKVPVDDVGAVQ